MTATAAYTETESPIRMETITVRLATRVEVELPVVHRTRGGQFVVVSNRLVKARTSVIRAGDHPYFVVHAASGVRSPVPPSIAKHTLATARQLAGYLELSGFFHAKTGRPLVTADLLRDALNEWRP